MAERQKRHREANHKNIAQKKRRHYRENRETVLERNRQWRLANPDRYRASCRISHHRRRARLAAVTVIDFTPEQFEQKMAYYGHACYLKLPGICTGAFDEIEHVKPIAKLGPHMLANLRPRLRTLQRLQVGSLAV